MRIKTRTFRAGLFVLCLGMLTVRLSHAATAAELLASGHVDESIAVLDKTISSSPNDAAAYNLLCRAYYSFGSWDRGITECEKAVSLEPNNSLYHMWLGRIYGEKADNSSFFSAASLAKKVHTEFETAVRLNPDNIEARSDLSEFYVEAPGMVGGGKDKAEAQAQALEKIAPAKAYWIRGRIAEKNKDMETAEKEYRAAIKLHENSDTWLDLASYYRREGHLNEMEDAINHAVAGKIDPPEALEEAAETLIRTDRNLPKAAELLRRYLASGNTVEEAPAFKAHYQLGIVLEKLGDKNGAAQEFSASLAMARGFSHAKEALDKVSR
jgi:tetratricopeptide (TPR) repeat protein